jgi:hypothetical protein
MDFSGEGTANLGWAAEAPGGRVLGARRRRPGTCSSLAPEPQPGAEARWGVRGPSRAPRRPEGQREPGGGGSGRVGSPGPGPPCAARRRGQVPRSSRPGPGPGPGPGLGLGPALRGTHRWGGAAQPARTGPRGRRLAAAGPWLPVDRARAPGSAGDSVSFPQIWASSQPQPRGKSQPLETSGLGDGRAQSSFEYLKNPSRPSPPRSGPGPADRSPGAARKMLAPQRPLQARAHAGLSDLDPVARCKPLFSTPGAQSTVQDKVSSARNK